MSLYNQLFGTNPFAAELLVMLGDPHVPRFRDCFINEAGDRIVIFTRTGGGNREHYDAPLAENNTCLRALPGYDRDKDDGFDSTYAYFYFKIPAEHRSAAAEIRAKQGVYDPIGRFQKLFADMRRGTETPDTRRAEEVAARILQQMRQGKNEDGITVIEV